jgi:hypothetical protein
MFLFDFSGAGTPAGDVTPPTVSVTAPVANANLTGSVTLSAAAADNVRVTRVELIVDGAVVANNTSSPYRTTWNAAAASLGPHVLTARAYDAAGNATTSAPVTVSAVDTTNPTLSITSPSNFSSVSRNTTVTIRATASDNRAVANVQFFVNNTLRCTDTTSAYTCSWPVPSARGVRYTLRARATDTSGNVTERTVTVTSR